jgi:hypothetical protein
MKSIVLSVLLAGVLSATAAIAARPADAPSGSMGICKDGTYSFTPEKKGACRGHKGVKQWYDEDTPESKPNNERALPSSSTGASATSVTKPMSPAMASHTSGSPTEPGAGGGTGRVWANTSTKVYHCLGDKYYGTTKQGNYMSEGDAKARGYHADHGKACTSN